MADDTTTDETEAAPVDEERAALLERFTAALGADAVRASEIARRDLTVRIDRAAWQHAGEVCRDTLGMTYFSFLSGIDWMEAPDLAGRYESAFAPEDAAAAEGEGGDLASWNTGVTGGDTRFQVFARVYNVRTRLGITLKADLDTDAPSVDTWTTVYRGADWHERETWEMFGFEFVGHPGLRHMYLPGEFEGYPLRKDFPLLARVVKPWPGLVDKEPIPGEGDGDDGGE